MIKLLIELFVIYIIFKLVFEFIFPVYRSAQQIKRKMDDIHQQMSQNHTNIKTEESRPSNKDKSSINKEYIDFEEIK